MKVFPLTMIFSSTMICLESKSWWILWMMLEFSTVSFIFYLYKEKKKEKIFIFLLFQTISSSMMMTFVFMSGWVLEETTKKMVLLVLSMSMLMKIGMFPFQNWLIKMMSTLSWVCMLLLFSWQKIIPMMVIMKMVSKTKLMSKFLILSLMTINFVLFKMSNTKPMMTTSSLIHNTWMMTPLLLMKELSMTYLASYTLIILPMIQNFMKSNFKNIKQQMVSKKIKKEMKFLMLSISGIPPSIGFFMKMFVLATFLMMSKKMTWLMLMVMSSCLTFFVYLQMFVKYFFMEKMNNSKKNNHVMKNESKEAAWIMLMTPMFMWV